MITESAAELRARALEWLREDPDEATRAELQALLDAADENAALVDRFGAQLAFGTAGLRAVMGAGPNRMNRSVVIRTTAGLCTYLGSTVRDAATRGIVVGYDGRRSSRRFAEDTAEVCAGLRLRTHLFGDVVPTPLVAFAVAQLNAAAGVMITASHNPPEYNGYKVYWGNGAQIIPPHDSGIAAAIAAIGALVTVPRPILKEARAKGLVLDIASSVEEQYLAGITKLARHRGIGTELRIVYTPLHGVGNRLARAALARAGFNDVITVPEQAEPDGAFPTVTFPNPEEKGAMDLALALASRVDAALVLANDPDADRLAVATRDEAGRWVQLTGNEVGVLLGYYLLVDDPQPARDRLVISTIVSSPMLGAMADALGVRHDEVLTGFKWIANRALEIEKQTGASFVFGYEEALGYTVGTLARDKDGIGAAAIMAELAGYYRARHGRGLLAQLEQVYRRFGLYQSAQHNVTLGGREGAARIADVMKSFRADSPAAIGEAAVTSITDYQRGERRTAGAPQPEALTLPPSNVIAFTLSDGSRVTVRPSGTEPKIKYYVDVREIVEESEPFADAMKRARGKLVALTNAFVTMAEKRGAVT